MTPQKKPTPCAPGHAKTVFRFGHLFSHFVMMKNVKKKYICYQ